MNWNLFFAGLLLWIAGMAGLYSDLTNIKLIGTCLAFASIFIMKESTK